MASSQGYGNNKVKTKNQIGMHEVENEFKDLYMHGCSSSLK